jgi:hypothetical protein
MMRSIFQDMLERRLISPMHALRARGLEWAEEGHEFDPDIGTYEFVGCCDKMLRELRGYYPDKDEIREIIGVVEAYAVSFKDYLNSRESRMAFRLLLKGKTIMNVFPVEGYFGEDTALSGDFPKRKAS